MSKSIASRSGGGCSARQVDDRVALAQQIADLKLVVVALSRRIDVLTSDGRPLRISEEWVALKDAAREFRVTVETMQLRAKINGFGKKVGGAWRVEMGRARAWRNGSSFERLSD